MITFGRTILEQFITSHCDKDIKQNLSLSSGNNCEYQLFCCKITVFLRPVRYARLDLYKEYL